METLKMLSPKILIFILSIVLIAAVFNVARVFVPDTLLTKEEKYENYGLTGYFDGVEEMSNVKEELLMGISGYLYFDSIPIPKKEASGDDISIKPFVYDVISDQYRQVFDFYGNDFNVVPLSTHSAVFLSVYKNNEGEINTVPVRFDLITNETQMLFDRPEYVPFDVSVDSNHSDRIAVTFLTKPDEVYPKLNSFSIIFNNPYTGDIEEISGAASPQWVSEEDILFYLKEDGVYYYNLRTQSEKPAFDWYKNHTNANSLAVSSNGNLVVLTIPSMNLLSVLSVSKSNGELVEEGIIFEDGVQYSDPVISPDGNYYAVIAESSEESKIEIRHRSSRTVISDFSLTEMDPAFLNLSEWSSVPLNSSNFSD